MRVTPETLTDEMVRAAHTQKLVTTDLLEVALGVGGCMPRDPMSDDDEECRDPTEDEIEEARAQVVDAINAAAQHEAEDMACVNHWHCDPKLAPHMCDKPDRSRPCPTCNAAARSEK